MSRRHYLQWPTPQRVEDILPWSQDVTRVFQEFPNFSITSTTAGPESNLSGDIGSVNIDVGSSVTKLWIKHTAPTITTGWKGYRFREAVKECVIQAFAGTKVVTVGDGIAYLTVGDALNGKNLIECHARVITAGTTNPTLIQIARYRASWVDMLSTRLMVDSGELGSETAATPYVIDTANDDVVEYDLLRIDIDQVSTVPPQGLVIRMTFSD